MNDHRPIRLRLLIARQVDRSPGFGIQSLEPDISHDAHDLRPFRCVLPRPQDRREAPTHRVLVPEKRPGQFRTNQRDPRTAATIVGAEVTPLNHRNVQGFEVAARDDPELRLRRSRG